MALRWTEISPISTDRTGMKLGWGSHLQARVVTAPLSQSLTVWKGVLWETLSFPGKHNSAPIKQTSIFSWLHNWGWTWPGSSASLSELISVAATFWGLDWREEPTSWCLFWNLSSWEVTGEWCRKAKDMKRLSFLQRRGPSKWSRDTWETVRL